MTIAQRQLPQLAMYRNLDNLPDVVLPEGYALRHYKPGDKASWDRIIQESFENAAFDFNKVMRKDYAYRPERVLFICRDDIPVATASAFYRPEWGTDNGYVHMVGCLKAHAGLGLGYQVSLAALHKMKEEGRNGAVLTTDDFRIPALKTYIKLGFQPLLTRENHRERWQKVFEVIGKPELSEKFKDILDGEIVIHEKGRPDDDNPDKYAPRFVWHKERDEKNGTGHADALADESFYKPSLLGMASVSPSEFIAGSKACFTLKYKAGKEGLGKGGRVSFILDGQQTIGKDKKEIDVKVQGPEGCVLKSRRMMFVVEEGCLKEGDEVTLTVGGEKGFDLTPLANRYEFKVIVSHGGSEPAKRLPEPVVINVMPRKMVKLEATVPCTYKIDAGETKVRVHITARDEFDNRVPIDGEIKVTCKSHDYESPKITAYMVNGVADCFVGVPAGTDTTYYAYTFMDIETTGEKYECISNPCVPSDDGLSLFIGDLHVHDFMSAAYGYTEDVYKWAIEDRNFDFLSVSVQLHGWINNQKWTIAKYMNERFLKEGRFVTFLGVEWQHTGYGDKVVHYLGGDQPYVCTDDKRYNRVEKLYEAARGSDAIIISHHSSYPAGSWCAQTDFDLAQTDIEMLTELWSMHGSSEGYDLNDRPLRTFDPQNNVMAALRKGLRLGFVAGSDTHSGRPGGSAKEPLAYWGGCAAVWAESLSRRDIFEALKARRTYALTGARIVLKMKVNGACMGSETEAAEKAVIETEVIAPGKIAMVQIMKNTEVLKVFTPGCKEFKTEYEDITGGPAFYHIRVTQDDGHLAVCSPVWVG